LGLIAFFQKGEELRHFQLKDEQIVIIMWIFRDTKQTGEVN
jgi:hypothetical protein